MVLTEQEKKLVEENMGLVGRVIKDCVHGLSPGSIYGYDDLHQIGCIGLCKAARTTTPGHGAFSTYAYILIRHEIFDALDYATRRGREQATDPSELPCVSLEDEDIGQTESCRELLDLLDRAETTATGVTAKGIRAIRLLAQGYTSREIGERYGIPANHVTAWVSKARKYLSSMYAQMA